MLRLITDNIDWAGLLYVLIIIIVVIVALILIKSYGGEVTGGATISKFENHVSCIFKKIFNKGFVNSHPAWLKFGDKHLELDGYNESEKLAFETQGPQHTRFDPRYDENYANYYNRILNDAAKKHICKKNNVDLIIIDYAVPKRHLTGYVLSRLYDLGRLKDSKNMSKYEKNHGTYIPEIESIPYRNAVYEKELGLKHELLPLIN